jgi:hypothetical protein
MPGYPRHRTRGYAADRRICHANKRGRAGYTRRKVQRCSAISHRRGEHRHINWSVQCPKKSLEATKQYPVPIAGKIAGGENNAVPRGVRGLRVQRAILAVDHSVTPARSDERASGTRQLRHRILHAVNAALKIWRCKGAVSDLRALVSYSVFLMCSVRVCESDSWKASWVLSASVRVPFWPCRREERNCAP